MNEEILSVKNICKRFGAVQALANVDLAINKGEIHCLVGENGSGKSTLIKIISGVEDPDSGEIYIDGKLHKKLTVMQSMKEGIQVIYQDLALFPNMSVAENISLNQRMEKREKFINWKKMRNLAIEELKNIGKNINPDELVEDLSVADKQIVAICRALTSGAKLIIMDEPTTALTKNEVENLFKIILNLKEKGISTIFVSHKLSEVFKISEKVAVLRDGKKVGDYASTEIDNEKLVYFMTGKNITSTNYTCSINKETEQPLLEVKNFSRKGNFIDINFKLYRGEILGITGLLGSGRTELATSIFGLNKPDSGETIIEGKNIKINSASDAIEAGVCYLPEDRLGKGLFIDKEIRNNLEVTIIKDFIKSGFVRSKDLSDTIEKLSKDLNIKTPSLDLTVSSLSGGNQQKVVVAKWIAANPKIFILDGPTVGIDVGSKSDIYQIIRGLAQKGIGIIIISDEIPEILKNTNRILVMKQGRIARELQTDCTNEEELNKIIIEKELS
ncbi:MAG: sugar ABC transporter ATP-binding protein [Actinomycetota bacterium]